MLGDLDVVFDGIIEQFRFLRHKALLCAERGSVHAADVGVAKADGAAPDVPESEQEPQESGLSAAGTARDAHDLLFGDGQAQVMQNFLV